MATQQKLPAAASIGDVAPKLVELTEKVLFGDVWARPGSPRATLASSPSRALWRSIVPNSCASISSARS